MSHDRKHSYRSHTNGGCLMSVTLAYLREARTMWAKKHFIMYSWFFLCPTARVFMRSCTAAVYPKAFSYFGRDRDRARLRPYFLNYGWYSRGALKFKCRALNLCISKYN